MPMHNNMTDISSSTARRTEVSASDATTGQLTRRCRGADTFWLRRQTSPKRRRRFWASTAGGMLWRSALTTWKTRHTWSGCIRIRTKRRRASSFAPLLRWSSGRTWKITFRTVHASMDLPWNGFCWNWISWNAPSFRTDVPRASLSRQPKPCRISMRSWGFPCLLV